MGFQGRLEVGLGASVTSPSSLAVEARGGKLASMGKLLACERREAETGEVEKGRRKEWRREEAAEEGRRRREEDDETLASAMRNGASARAAGSCGWVGEEERLLVGMGSDGLAQRASGLGLRAGPAYGVAA